MQRLHGPSKVNSFPALVRHFFGRFFDAESLSPQGDPQVNVVQALGLLAAPSAFFVLVFRPVTLTGWSLVSARYIFVSFSMVVMGFIMVFEWDALFPDKRDYQVLMPLPLRLGIVFLAKAAALGIFLGLFLVDINLFGVLFWPGIDGGSDVPAMLAAHAAALLAGGLFSALAIAALQGMLVTFLRGKTFRRVSICIQTALMGVLVLLLFLSPLIGFAMRGIVRTGHPLVYWFPGFWFTGVYELMRPATTSPELATFGHIGLRALCGAAGLLLLTYLPFYHHHARRIVETPEASPAGPGPFRRWAARVSGLLFLRTPIERAVFRFISQTITRSTKHRLFLATYGGFGAALAVITLSSDPAGLLRLPLTLSFILVSGLRAAFNFPAELRANWAFQVSETGALDAYLKAARKWIVVCAILPLFLLLAPVEFACFHWTDAVFHLVYGLALSVLLAEIMFFDFRKVPFTCAHLPGKVNLVGLGVLYILGFTAYSGVMAAVETWLIGSPAAAVIFFAAAASAWLLLRRSRGRALGAGAALDYEDPGDPVVRTLNLTVR
jgi:hypothetical protein